MWKKVLLMVIADIYFFILIYLLISQLYNKYEFIFSSIFVILMIPFQLIHLTCKESDKYSKIITQLDNNLIYKLSVQSKNTEYIFKVQEFNKEYWKLINEKCDLEFNLEKHIYPKLYICGYFIKNLHYPIINKEKLPIKNLFHSLDVSSIIKYKKLVLNFLIKTKKRL